MTRPLHIAKLKIRNVLGISFLELNAGQFNLLEGRNGSRKTSILEAITGALGGGNRADLIRNGTDGGETLVEFANSYRMKAEYLPDATKRSIESGDGLIVRKPADWIKSRLNMNSFSPVSFILASPREQIEHLLEVSPIELATGDFLAAIGSFTPPKIDLKSATVANPLQVIEETRQKIYTDRTGLNRLVDERKGSIAVIARTLPAAGEVPNDPADVRQELAILQGKMQSEKDAIKAKASMVVAAAKEQAVELERAAQKIRDDKIKASRDEFDVAYREIVEDRNLIISAASKAESDELQAMIAAHQPGINALNKELGAAEVAVREFDSIERTRRDLVESENKLDEYKAGVAAATDAIKKLDSLKATVMKSLPCKGLEISDGELRYNGVLLKTLNTAKQTEIALEIAVAASGDIKLILLDHAEVLDKESLVAIQAWAQNHEDVQFFLASVADHDLTLNGEPVTIGLPPPKESTHATADASGLPY